MGAKLSKKEIREQLRGERDALANDIWNEKSQMIQSSILRSRLYSECDHLLIYADFQGEVGTNIILEDALLKEKKVYLPKVMEGFDEARMEFYRIFSSYELVNGYRGIMEPMGIPSNVFDYKVCEGQKILMLVPGVSFDNKGYRLGYGKGYYDNYLSDKPGITTCGICFSFQIKEKLPANDRDVKLDYLISEDVKTSEINKMKFKG